MKKLLFLVLLLIGFGAKSQGTNPNAVNIVTHYFKTERMVWSDSDEKYLFFPLDDRTRRSCMWTFNILDDGSGTIDMQELSGNDKSSYHLSVYEWKTNFKEDVSIVMMQFIQNVNGMKGSCFVQKFMDDYGAVSNAVSIFLPEEELFIYFDNFQSLDNEKTDKHR